MALLLFNGKRAAPSEAEKQRAFDAFVKKEWLKRQISTEKGVCYSTPFGRAFPEEGLKKSVAFEAFCDGFFGGKRDAAKVLSDGQRAQKALEEKDSECGGGLSKWLGKNPRNATWTLLIINYYESYFIHGQQAALDALKAAPEPRAGA